MPKYAFRLPSEEVPMGSSAARSPGLRRMRMELTRNGSLGRSFDNKCAHAPAISDDALTRAPTR
ncbi:hypothetical protein E1281_25255 [Actinomadura sp. KC345]|uniref:hypothetical protein n=1 Tax=Actinomadura sp. KC345 TaxID=2530371 RepID=UPI0010464F51|nr:hypothetical protein [Actinomadura sp. KC345]TDC48119.1 hypothetical protein E1281_25255 [Actinomadura sp. KC345]